MRNRIISELIMKLGGTGINFEEEKHENITLGVAISKLKPEKKNGD